MSISGLRVRLRTPTPELIALPWDLPLAEWDATEVPLRDIPVGQSRHLVKFVETPVATYAIKELPYVLAEREYTNLLFLEQHELPAVTPVGHVQQGPTGTGLLVTEFLPRSWQYRRLFMRMPAGASGHRDRLLDAMASLLVELHRTGVFWGDCSLGNTLFTRDGQALKAHLVDAETSEIHSSLSDGQRDYDLSIMVDNVVGGLADVAARLDREIDYDDYMAAAQTVAERYNLLWDELHRVIEVPFDKRYAIDGHIRRLNALGFAVEELQINPAEGPREGIQAKVVVAGRTFYADKLEQLTGLVVGEGQAQILLNDLRAFGTMVSEGGIQPAIPDIRGYIPEDRTTGVTAEVEADVDPLPGTGIGRRWVEEVLHPGIDSLRPYMTPDSDPIQAFCDLLEIRWLLSETAGHDVGTEAALSAYATRQVPSGSVSELVDIEAPTVEMRQLDLDG